MLSLSGKVAIVTGSSMGIGKAIAVDLGNQGAKLVLNARNATKLQVAADELTAQGFEVLAIAGDVSKWEDVSRLIDATVNHYGRLDILVNNAGVATRGSITNMNHEVFQQVMDVNFLGSVFPTKAALPHLEKTQGSVILVSSIASFYGLPYNSVYCSSKKALAAFAQSLRIEVKARKIHVGIAYVGFTENDPQKIIMDADGQLIYLEERKGIKKQTPQQVAKIIRNMVIRRKSEYTLSLAGKGLRFIATLFPGLIHMIYQGNIETIRANSEGKPNYVKK